jgi:transcriptional regulator with XRE-family HTH domain
VVGRDLDELRSLVGPDRVRTARTSGGCSATALCRARLAVGLTMTQLASKIGVVPSTVSRWENAVRTPPAEARARLAEVLRITEQQLADMLASSPPRRSDGVRLPGLGRLRHHRGLTQREFRAAVGIGPTAANSWEHGRVRVPADRLAAVAGALDLDVPSLVRHASRVPAERPEARRLVTLRRRAGVSRRELAHHLCVSIRTVAHWEAGTREVPLAVVRPMARCLGCSPALVRTAAGVRLPPVPHPSTWTPDGLPEVLVALRGASGWSAAAVGRRLGVAGSVVRGWETGSTRPPASSVHRLEMIYGLPHGRLARLVPEGAAGGPGRKSRPTEAGQCA